MNLRILSTAAIAMVCLATTAGVLWSYASSSADPQPKTSRLDIPWVKSSSAEDLKPDGSLSIEDLRKLVANIRVTPEKRAQAIYLLAKAKDWDSVEILIAQLDDPAPLVRGRAAAAIRHTLGTDFYFRAQDDQTKRLASIDGIRRYWNSRKSNPPISE